MYSGQLPPTSPLLISLIKIIKEVLIKFYVLCRLSANVVRKQFEFMQLLAIIIACDDVVSIILTSSDLLYTISCAQEVN